MMKEPSIAKWLYPYSRYSCTSSARNYSPESKTLYLETHDYSLKSYDKKLLNGIAIPPEIPRTYLIFESSGFDKTENINHNIENNIKNMKSVTDALKHCAYKYMAASFATFFKVHTFSIHTIQEQKNVFNQLYDERNDMNHVNEAETVKTVLA
ncbi:hypothetical protein K501DRAFT_273484 [Backusella circina FSU 941]|nr:hypothetical protein K501DRAFT_273484 [Backusella circina FSU 941]